LDYYYYLRYDKDSYKEWENILDILSVPETYFWREADQIRALVDIIVPEHYRNYGCEPIRIWSAACASGEEPFTIAMELNEAGWFGRLPIEIQASDGSRKAVEKAKEGLYRERAFRNIPAELKEK